MTKSYRPLKFGMFRKFRRKYRTILHFYKLETQNLNVRSTTKTGLIIYIFLQKKYLEPGAFFYQACNFFAIRLRIEFLFLNEVDVQLIF